jgi:hypothetical protein
MTLGVNMQSNESLAFPANLDQISDDALLRETSSVIAAGRRGTAVLLVYLGEVERRRLHLYAASPSMFDFCVRRLGMSEGEAFRRITAARLARRYPMIYDLVATGKVHLSALVLLRDFLSPENHAALLQEAAGKSKSEVQLMVARIAPRPDVKGRVTRLPRSHIDPLAPGRYRVEFTAGPGFKDKLELALDLSSHANPTRDFATVLEHGLDLLIAERERKKLGKAQRPRPARESQSGDEIGRGTRRETVARDGLRCSYLDEQGRRCPARAFLEFDHRLPRALGGGSHPGNVRMLCRQHNQLAAEQVFGQETIEQRIEERRGAGQAGVRTDLR